MNRFFFLFGAQVAQMVKAKVEGNLFFCKSGGGGSGRGVGLRSFNDALQNIFLGEGFFSGVRVGR